MSEEVKEKEVAEENAPVTDEQTPSGEDHKKDKKKKLNEKVAALEKEKEELSDRLLRKVAEFDNYRKRTEKEKPKPTTTTPATARRLRVKWTATPFQ